MAMWALPPSKSPKSLGYTVRDWKMRRLQQPEKAESETKCKWKESEARTVAAAATKKPNPTPPRGLENNDNLDDMPQEVQAFQSLSSNFFKRIL